MGRLLLYLAGAIAAAAANATDMKYSVLQGATSDSVTHFTVLAPASENLHFQARIDGQPSLLAALETTRVPYPGSDWVVHRIKATGLRANRPYILEILNDRGQVNERRKFQTLDPHKKGGRIATGSCMVRQLHNAGLWNNLEKPANRPDLLMITGDIVYLDRARLFPARAPERGLEVWEEFVRSRQAVNLYFWETLVPTLTVWDDHDAGGDNTDASWAIMPEVRRIYDTFMANHEIPGFLEAGPGMSKQFRMFGKNFIILDGRSYRNMSLVSPLYGIDQDRWLLRKVQPGPNIIVSGTQFFGGPIKKDSLEYNWPDIAQEWTQRLREHGEWKGGAFAFVSGDVHFSEVQDLEPELFGYWTVEITSSNIHSFGFPGHYALKPHNPRRREVTGTHNIVLLEFSPQSSGFDFVARSLGWRGNDLFKTVVSVAAPMAAAPASTNTQPCESLLSPAPVQMKIL